MYGLLLAIRRKEEELLVYFWDTEVFDERHFFIAVDEMIKQKWPEGLTYLFGSERSKEMYLSFYPSERMHFYEDLITRLKMFILQTN
jgi:hypothetical protein